MTSLSQCSWKSLITGDASKQADSARQEKSFFYDLEIIIRHIQRDEMEKEKENTVMQ